MAADTAKNSSFLRQLVTSDSRMRASALESLRLYLRRGTVFSSLELSKLWKGLFYCMYMSDRPRAQQQLARDIADLVDILASVNVVPWFRAFWECMAREWSGIDSLRMDKYLYLLRCYVTKGWTMLKRSGWKGEAMNGYIAVIEDGPLCVSEGGTSNGIRYHVLDIYVDELDKVDEKREISEEVLQRLIGPVKQIAKESPTKAVRGRAKEVLNDDRLQGWANRDHEVGKAVASDNEDEFGGFDD